MTEWEEDREQEHESEYEMRVGLWEHEWETIKRCGEGRARDPKDFGNFSKCMEEKIKNRIFKGCYCVPAH